MISINTVKAVLCLAVVVSSWVSQGFFLQRITELGFKNYGFIEWVIKIGWSSGLLFWFFYPHSEKIENVVDGDVVDVSDEKEEKVLKTFSNIDGEEETHLIKNSEPRSLSMDGNVKYHLLENNSGGNDKLLKVHTRRSLKYAFFLTLIISISGYTWYESLSQTTVSANTAIFNSQCVVVFLLSYFILGESATWIKLLSVLSAIFGVALVSFSGLQDSKKDDNKEKVHSTVWGYILDIISLVTYAGFEVYWRKASNTEVVRADGSVRRINSGVKHSGLFLGAIGFFNLILLWPFLILLDRIGFETFEIPRGEAFTLLLYCVFLDAILNFCLILGIVWSSPLFMSVGSLLTIPISMFFDLFENDVKMSLLGYTGVLLIVLGFLGISTSGHK